MIFVIFAFWVRGTIRNAPFRPSGDKTEGPFLRGLMLPQGNEEAKTMPPGIGGGRRLGKEVGKLRAIALSARFAGFNAWRRLLS